MVADFLVISSTLGVPGAPASTVGNYHKILIKNPSIWLDK
jgi:hypothetical protein